MTTLSTSSAAQAQPRSPALAALMQRGFVHQCTALTRLDDLLAGAAVPIYAGFDATADSLHVGHLLPIMALRRLQQCGHKPIVLMGGGTTRIGDPSFRSAARPMLSDEQIASNIAGIRAVFERFLRFGDGPSDAVMVNNADWLDGLGYIDVLREVGSHFSVNRMLAFDSVKSRLEKQENLSFLEFNYMILQAYDFLELSRRFGCRVQLGGSDQWGNIVSGVDLVRRAIGQEVFGLTAPLLTTASGAKMGKTAAGAVWLNAARLRPFDYWQFWRNTEDGDVVRFLRLFTDLPMNEIARWETLAGAPLNEAKHVLATLATALAHGPAAASLAAEEARGSIGSGGMPNDVPTLLLTAAQLREGVAVVELLVSAGMARSKGDARRLIQGRGVKLDGVAVEDVEATVSAKDFETVAGRRLSVGKKRQMFIGPQP
ncbi:tyrosine--tRNA ligase [Variovorax sp. CY25R-8]|uniref:tyrosine--tRNA ligase n=1 Tax=Variovorax sp. CY25R-8 TaxID=2855501 RepID=UPI0021BA6FE1|nr:tyrosine--tRNA ligase [Variovorax sp. CY25R-8]MCT8176437.1 tyrosine--tRNA ligase [Variovorax sp. CY25R-8]